MDIPISTPSLGWLHSGLAELNAKVSAALDDARLLDDQRTALQAIQDQLDTFRQTLSSQQPAPDDAARSQQEYQTLFITAEHQAQKLALLDELRTALARELDLKTIISIAVELTAKTFGYTHVSLYLLQGDVFRLQHQVGYQQVITEFPVSEGVAGRVVRTGEPVLVKDAHSDPAFLFAMDNISSEICVPVLDQQRVVGVFIVETAGQRSLGEDDLSVIIAAAEHVSLALAQARLYNEARESEAKTRALLNALPDMMVRMDGSGRYLEVKPAVDFDPLLPVDQLVGKRTEEVLPADLVPETLQRIRQTLTTGESRAYEYKLWENEEWRDYEARLAASGSDEVLAIVRDITERKRLEQALQISLERYDRASQASGVGVWEWDIETSQIYIDPSFKAFLGYEDNAPIADPRELFAYVHPDDRVGLFESLYHYLEQPDHGYEFECRALTHAGGFRWMLIRGQAQGNDVGAPYRMSGTYIDISERKAAQLALQENERRYAAMLNAIPDVILRVHRDGTYLDFHPPHEASLSATPETVLGRSIYDLLPAPAAEEAMGYVRRALETGAMQVWETRMPCNDVLIDFEVRVVALNAEEVLMLGRNIQDRKEVARHQMESERTVLLRKFIADVSHDLRTPLATLMTSTFVIGKLGERLREVRQQILRQADLSAQARPLLDAMDQHVTKITERTVTLEKTSLRLQRVIEAMTDMVRLDGENIYNFKPHEMSDVVRRGLDGKQLVARERNIVLIVQFPEDPIVGLVDEGEFRHVVKNLVDNALDYTFPGGRVSVRLVLENNCPVIEVEDTGIGISEDDLPHIFDRFYRADKARSTETGGVGLGLAIVKRVVEAHNGRIEVRSRLGEGSIFRVTLPPYRDEA